MEIKVLFTTIEDLEKEIQNLRDFRERYADLISGRRDPNDDEQELERLGILSDTQHTLDNLLFNMKNADTE